jgi:hypothetical protein
MTATESIAEILGLGASLRTVGELESAVSTGLPKRALERLPLGSMATIALRAHTNLRWARRRLGSDTASGFPSMKARRQNGWPECSLLLSMSGMTVTRPASG